MRYPSKSPQSGEPAAGLPAVLELTEQVQRAVQAGEWQLATALEAERRAALERLLLDRSAFSPELRAALLGLEERNRRLSEELERERTALLNEASALRRGRHAAASYDRASAAEDP